MRQKVIRGGTAVILRQAVSLPINAIGIVLTSRFLSPTDYGVQAILVPIMALFIVLIDQGTSQAIVQSVTFPSSRLLRQVQLLKIGGTLLAVALVGVFSHQLIQLFSLSDDFVFLLVASAGVGWLQSQRTYQSAKLQRQLEWEKLARIEMIEILVYNITLVITAYFLRSVWCFVWAQCFRMGCGSVILKSVGETFQVDTKPGNANLATLLRFGVPLQATLVLSLAMGLANPVIVGHFSGLAAVGLINWSTNIVSLPLLPLQPLPAFLFSILAERTREGKNDNELVAKITQIGTILVSALSLFEILMLGFLVSPIFGVQWEAAIPVASILILNNVMYFPVLIIAAQLTANGHSGAWLLINVFAACLVWSMAGVGTILFGMNGYASGFVLASFAALALEGLLARKLVGSRFQFRDTLYLALSVAIPLIVIRLFLKDLADLTQPIVTILGILLGLAIFFVAIWFRGRDLLRDWGLCSLTEIINKVRRWMST